MSHSPCRLPSPRPAGVYSKRILAATPSPLETYLRANDTAAVCSGSGKTTLGLNIATSAFVFEGASSSATIVEADNALCDGEVTVQVGSW